MLCLCAVFVLYFANIFFNLTSSPIMPLQDKERKKQKRRMATERARLQRQPLNKESSSESFVPVVGDASGGAFPLQKTSTSSSVDTVISELNATSSWCRSSSDGVGSVGKASSSGSLIEKIGSNSGSYDHPIRHGSSDKPASESSQSGSRQSDDPREAERINRSAAKAKSLRVAGLTSAVVAANSVGPHRQLQAPRWSGGHDIRQGSTDTVDSRASSGSRGSSVGCSTADTDNKPADKRSGITVSGIGELLTCRRPAFFGGMGFVGRLGYFLTSVSAAKWGQAGDDEGTDITQPSPRLQELAFMKHYLCRLVCCLQVQRQLPMGQFLVYVKMYTCSMLVLCFATRFGAVASSDFYKTSLSFWIAEMARWICRWCAFA